MGTAIGIEDKVAKLDDLVLAIGQRVVQFFATGSEDLTMREMFLLETLGRREPATMTELASALVVPLTTMTSIVTRMVQKGYLERRRIEEDRRVVQVTLTAEGRRLFEQHRQDYIRSVRSVLAMLSEEEQHRILALIGEVLTAMANG